jgi:hypothetical protein
MPVYREAAANIITGCRYQVAIFVFTDAANQAT